jgi:hypothetical protein
LADALARISMTITDAEAQLNGERDRLARETESKARAEQAIAIEQALAGYQGASSALAAACDRVTECSQEAAEVAAVVRNLAGKIADAGANLLASTNAYVLDVASGAMSMKPQVAPRVEAPAPPAAGIGRVQEPLSVSGQLLARGRWRNPLRLQAWPSFGSD